MGIITATATKVHGNRLYRQKQTKKLGHSTRAIFQDMIQPFSSYGAAGYGMGGGRQCNLPPRIKMTPDFGHCFYWRASKHHQSRHQSRIKAIYSIRSWPEVQDQKWLVSKGSSMTPWQRRNWRTPSPTSTMWQSEDAIKKNTIGIWRD